MLKEGRAYNTHSDIFHPLYADINHHLFSISWHIPNILNYSSIPLYLPPKLHLNFLLFSSIYLPSFPKSLDHPRFFSRQHSNSHFLTTHICLFKLSISVQVRGRRGSTLFFLYTHNIFLFPNHYLFFLTLHLFFFSYLSYFFTCLNQIFFRFHKYQFWPFSNTFFPFRTTIFFIILKLPISLFFKPQCFNICFFLFSTTIFHY